MKTHLKNKWKKVFQDHKAAQQAKKEDGKSTLKALADQSRHVSAAQAADEEEKAPKDTYKPKSVWLDDVTRDNMIQKFMTKLQTPAKSTDPPFDANMMRKAEKVAQELELAIYDLAKG